MNRNLFNVTFAAMLSACLSNVALAGSAESRQHEAGRGIRQAENSEFGKPSRIAERAKARLVEVPFLPLELKPLDHSARAALGIDRDERAQASADADKKFIRPDEPANTSRPVAMDELTLAIDWMNQALESMSASLGEEFSVETTALSPGFRGFHMVELHPGMNTMNILGMGNVPLYAYLFTLEGFPVSMIKVEGHARIEQYTRHGETLILVIDNPCESSTSYLFWNE